MLKIITSNILVMALDVFTYQLPIAISFHPNCIGAVTYQNFF